MNKKYNLKLDLQFRCNNSIMKFNQFDSNTSDFFMRITNGGNLVDIEKAIVVLAVIKPSGKVASQFVEVKNGLVYADLKPSMIDEIGIYTAQAMLILEDERVITDVISYEVEEDKIFSLLNDTVEATEEFTLLADMLSRLSTIEISEEQRMINEAERILSEENRKIEEAKRVEAELVRQHEEADRTKYDATRESNENIRKINEEARISSENVRLENEANRIEQETNRVKAEQLRKDNYNLMTEDEERRRSEANAHKEAEALRVSAENTRVNEEAKRRATEQARVSAENTRVSNENTRKANEVTRQTNETQRVEAETQRQNRYNSFIADAEANTSNFENYTNNAKVKEEERKSNELDRKSQETKRVSNEVERISNENTRKANEVTRIESEKQRVDAENLRKEKIIEIQSDYDSLKKVIIDENASANLQNQINQTNSQLEHKPNKNHVWNMANMGQDVKEAMTGGSVAVVGVNTVLRENIVNESVYPEKTNFIDNIINIELERGSISAGNDADINVNTTVRSKGIITHSNQLYVINNSNEYKYGVITYDNGIYDKNDRGWLTDQVTCIPIGKGVKINIRKINGTELTDDDIANLPNLIQIRYNFNCAEIGDVNSLKNTLYNEEELSNYELGGINAGVSIVSTNRVRNVDFIKVNKGDIIKFKNSNYLYKYGIASYDIDKTYISKDYGWMTKDEFIVEHDGYIKCVLAYLDNREITSDNIEYVCIGRLSIQHCVVNEHSYDIKQCKEITQNLNELAYTEIFLESELWEIGGITAGNNVNATNRVRLIEKFRVKKGTVIQFNKDSSLFKYGISLYDEAGVYNGVDYGWRYDNFTVPIDGYFRLVLAYINNDTITDMLNIVDGTFLIIKTLKEELASTNESLKEVLSNVNKTDTLNIAINSISVEYGRIKGASYVFARIPKYINNGMQIKPIVAITSKDGSISGVKRSTLDYAKDNNCIFTVNAGLFNMSNSEPVGQLIIDTVSLINTPMTDDNGVPIHDEECYPLAIDKNGNLTTYPRNVDTSEMLEDGVKYAVTAWGKLVDNFKICTEDINNEIVHKNKRYIRQSIGQYQNGDYCVCSVDMTRGNVQNEAGLYYEELAQIFVDKGVKFAYSLDGGGSTQTVIGKRQLNPIYEGSTGRKVPTVIEFVVE